VSGGGCHIYKILDHLAGSLHAWMLLFQREVGASVTCPSPIPSNPCPEHTLLVYFKAHSGSRPHPVSAVCRRRRD